MLRTQIERRSMETAFCIAVELACTNQEMATVMDELFILSSEHLLASNLYVVKKCMETLSLYHDIPQKHRVRHEDLQKAFCELFFTVVLHLYQQGYNPANMPSSLISRLEPTIDSRLKVEALATDNKLLKCYHKFVREFKDLLAPSTVNNLCVLAFFIRKGKSDKAQQLTSQILMSKDIVPYHAVTYNEITRVKQILRRDIVWVLWRIVLSVCPVEAMNTVNGLLDMFMHRFQKRSRSKKLNLLYLAIAAACDQRALKSVKLSYDREAILQAAVEKSVDVFTDVLKSHGDGGQGENAGEDGEDMDANEDGDAQLSKQEVMTKDITYANLYYYGIKTGKRDAERIKKKKRKEKETKSKKGSGQDPTQDLELPLYLRVYTNYETR